MALMASVILSLALSYDLEPKVQWVFSVKACEFCNGKQIEIMERFYQPGDQILIADGDHGRSAANQIESRLKALFPKILIKRQTSPFGTGVTGWIWSDAFTGESISYQSKAGKYGEMRARAILALFRNPKTAKSP